MADCRQEAAAPPLQRVNVATAKVTGFAPEVATVLTLLFLPALYVAWPRIEEPSS